MITDTKISLPLTGAAPAPTDERIETRNQSELFGVDFGEARNFQRWVTHVFQKMQIPEPDSGFRSGAEAGAADHDPPGKGN